MNHEPIGAGNWFSPEKLVAETDELGYFQLNLNPAESLT
jgi:hypothetical protein